MGTIIRLLTTDKKFEMVLMRYSEAERKLKNLETGKKISLHCPFKMINISLPGNPMTPCLSPLSINGDLSLFYSSLYLYIIKV